jgi:hypothetical protein
MGSDKPATALQWGRDNIKLVHKNQVMEMEYATWNIVGENIEYSIDHDFNYTYRFIFNIPLPLDPSSLYLLISHDRLVSLTTMIDDLEEQVAAESDGQESVPEGTVTTAQSSWVGGGYQNSATSYHAAVAAGFLNNASAAYAAVLGGRENQADGLYSAVTGGYANQASGRDSFIGGGSRNDSSGYHSTVSGGIRNQAIGTDTTVGGGSYNIADNLYAAVCGGTQNQALGSGAVIPGGSGNNAEGEQSVVTGGLANTASGNYAAIGGGQGNTIAGNYSTIPGGLKNLVSSNFAFAAGHHASILDSHPGVFIFSDSLEPVFASQGANEFAVRATGGVRFVTGVDQHGLPTSGVTLPAGSGSWSSLSDRRSKENLSPVDSQAILETLANIPITTWNYIAQEESIRHIGPMAQDFYSAFEIGENDLTISSTDADGISLVAIQGLYQRALLQEEKLAELEEHQSHLENRILLQNILLFLIIPALTLLWKKRNRLDYPGSR